MNMDSMNMVAVVLSDPVRNFENWKAWEEEDFVSRDADGEIRIFGVPVSADVNDDIKGNGFGTDESNAILSKQVEVPIDSEETINLCCVFNARPLLKQWLTDTFTHLHDEDEEVAKLARTMVKEHGVVYSFAYWRFFTSNVAGVVVFDDGDGESDTVSYDADSEEAPSTVGLDWSILDSEIIDVVN